MGRERWRGEVGREEETDRQRSGKTDQRLPFSSRSESRPATPLTRPRSLKQPLAYPRVIHRSQHVEGAYRRTPHVKARHHRDDFQANAKGKITSRGPVAHFRRVGSWRDKKEERRERGEEREEEKNREEEERKRKRVMREEEERERKMV